MLLNHYECAPNTKSNNIPPSATSSSPPPPDRTIQSINPGINFDYNEKDQTSNYTNLFPQPFSKASTPECLSSVSNKKVCK